MTNLIDTNLVFLDHDFGENKEDVLHAFAQRVVEQGRATDADQLFSDFMARETKTDTGIVGGIAIPHCRSAAVTTATLVAARARPKVNFGAPDGSADLIFGIAAPDGADQEHLKLLAKLARSLIKPDFVGALRSAQEPAEFVALVQGALSDEPAKPATAPAPAETTADADDDAPLIVAVTSCATGIAHTYMAADALTAAAKAKGIKFVVETQGSAGMTPLEQSTIANADAVIFAHDVDVRERGRFAGKPVVDVPVKKGVDEPAALIDRALAASKDPKAPRVSGEASDASESSAKDSIGVGERIRGYLMTGVSHMIPFVAAGGILLGIAFLLAPIAFPHAGAAGPTAALTGVTDGNDPVAFMKWLSTFSWVSLQSWAVLLFWIGKWAFAFMVPVLSGYIAFGIADRPGLTPGFVGGFLSVLVGAGFLGGIVTGFLAGYVALWITKWKVPAGVRGIMPVLVIPLLATAITGVVGVLVIGPPMRWINDGLTNFLNSMSGASAIVLGIIVGLMMCFDLGGPLNKVAYTFATTGLANIVSNTTPQAHVMTAVMAAGMVPPLAIALATLVRPKLWTAQERDTGRAAWLLGASFVTEGAIPFAAADPLRTIPAFMVGGAVTGGMTMAFGCGQLAPHGGIWVVALINNPLMFVVSVIVGTIISALLIGLFRQSRVRKLGTVEA